jgi:hypothetical protein
MRLTIIVALLAIPASLNAQSLPCSQPAQTVLQFDPYKPSDLAIVRNYGGTVFATAPLETLLNLDPYVPTHAALLRQAGGAIPAWAYGAYPWFVPIASRPECEAVRASVVPDATPPAITTLQNVLAVLETRPSAAVTARKERTPGRHLGVSIEYEGRVWTSAGAAVPFSETEFVRVGERSGSPIFKRASGNDPVIFVRTTPGMVAPFRASR